MKIEIDDDFADVVVCEKLKNTYDALKREFKSDNIGGVFSWELDEEKKELKKMLKALKKVHNWYAGIDNWLVDNDI